MYTERSGCERENVGTQNGVQYTQQTHSTIYRQRIGYNGVGIECCVRVASHRRSHTAATAAPSSSQQAAIQWEYTEGVALLSCSMHTQQDFVRARVRSCVRANRFACSFRIFIWLFESAAYTPKQLCASCLVRNDRLRSVYRRRDISTHKSSVHNTIHENPRLNQKPKKKTKKQKIRNNSTE